MELRDLSGRWRKRALLFRSHADESLALAYERCADELDRVFENSDMKVLSLEEAEAESGYTKSHIRRLIREGVIPNSGTRSDPRVQRSHLPRKPGHGIGGSPCQDLSLRSQAARAIAQGER